MKKMAEAIVAAGLPGTVSNSAGAYVCNDVLYSVLHACAGTSVRVGFIHVPAHEGTPSLPLQTTIRALTAAIAVL